MKEILNEPSLLLPSLEGQEPRPDVDGGGEGFFIVFLGSFVAHSTFTVPRTIITGPSLSLIGERGLETVAGYLCTEILSCILFILIGTVAKSEINCNKIDQR